MKVTVLSVFVLCLVNTANAKILPDNNLHLQDNPLTLANMTEAEFNTVIDKIIAVWAPYAKLHGATLTVSKNWTDPTVNAYAQQTGTNWNVAMFGGLARRPEITLDGFALVVCHELGHHFGGYPFYESLSWAASEGQSDYFATQFCARKIWGSAKAYNERFRNESLPVGAKDKCNAVWKDADSQNLCYRTALAGKSLADLFWKLSQSAEPTFDTPDKKEVPRTSTSHPAAQCRLDTYFNGGLCPTVFDGEKIPGKTQAQRNSNASEEEAGKVSCMSKAGFTLGFRPRCWFKPLI